MGWLANMDEKMAARGEKAKTTWQFIKFNAMSLGATVVQLVLVNTLCLLLKGWTTPLPGWLGEVFSEATLGEGNSNWGYVLPFLLSNLGANIFAYLMNQKTTFKSDASTSHFVIFISIMLLLILFSTWFQGVIVNAIRSSSSALMQSLYGLAPTIAALCASLIQFLILFPLEKYVLLKEKAQ